MWGVFFQYSGVVSFSLGYSYAYTCKCNFVTRVQDFLVESVFFLFRRACVGKGHCVGFTPFIFLSLTSQLSFGWKVCAWNKILFRFHVAMNFIALSTSGATDHVMSAVRGLELGRKSGFQYLGQTTVRNITSLAWDSCFYSNSTNQTTHLTVYFSG